MGGLFGAILPPIFSASLERFGFKPTIIAWSLTVILSTGAGAACIKSRNPSTSSTPTKTKPSTQDFAFLRKPIFWILSIATVVQGLAHYVPSIYLPSYAHDFGMTAAQGSLVLSMLNVATAVGQPLQGMLALVLPLSYIHLPHPS
jgi:predicted MFS family arabinose efflux permease